MEAVKTEENGNAADPDSSPSNATRLVAKVGPIIQQTAAAAAAQPSLSETAVKESAGIPSTETFVKTCQEPEPHQGHEQSSHSADVATTTDVSTDGTSETNQESTVPATFSGGSESDISADPPIVPTTGGNDFDDNLALSLRLEEPSSVNDTNVDDISDQETPLNNSNDSDNPEEDTSTRENGKPKTEELKLRSYQEELTQEALQGKNCLIIAPTGTGKTHVALAIAKNHLDTDSFEEDRKVVFFVPTVALVDQQLKQFMKYMDPTVRCQGLSGEEVPKLSLTDIIAINDVLVMTPQIILNALERKAIELSVFSLMIFDECHRMMKNHPYNGIMSRYYVDAILNKTPMSHRLPQVVGLTASPGVGQANSTEKAAEHILQLCANMAATEICTVREKKNIDELQKHVNNPNDDTEKVHGRHQDPFKDKITQVMTTIENKLRSKAVNEPRLIDDVPNIRQLVQAPAERGSDPYTQFLSRLTKAIVTVLDQSIRRFFMACLPQLDVYNNALVINADCRTKDALNFIKTAFADNETNRDTDGYDETDEWLDKLFTDMEKDLQEISESPVSRNPKLDVLEKKILQFYEKNKESQGIIFCKTRAMTAALVAWMKETPSLAHLNPHNLIGANRPTSHQTEGMTHNKLEDVLKYFKGGEHKVIIATTVAEEGLDVKQCNYVIRYEHVTNDIARVQARGRARADNAEYVLVAERGRGTIERDEANKLRERMMNRALNHIYSQTLGNRARKIHELQVKAKVERDMARQGKILSAALRKGKTHEGDYELRCLKCDAFGAFSQDLRTIAEVHHVTIEENFEERVTLVPHPKPKKFDNWEMRARMLCKKCRQEWGIKAIHNSVPYCVLQIASFIVIGPRGDRKNCKRWKDIHFTVNELSPEDMQNMCLRAMDDGFGPEGEQSQNVTA